jgi:hypothetical protein
LPESPPAAGPYESGEEKRTMTTSAELEALFSHLTLPQEDVTRLIQELIEKQRQFRGDERRATKRYPMACPVVAVPMDDLEKPGEAFAAITRDISSQGIAIYHTRPIHEPYLAIQWNVEEGEQLRVLVEVVRCRPVGPFFYEIGGSFISQPTAG